MVFRTGPTLHMHTAQHSITIGRYSSFIGVLKIYTTLSLTTWSVRWRAQGQSIGSILPSSNVKRRSSHAEEEGEIHYDRQWRMWQCCFISTASSRCVCSTPITQPQRDEINDCALRVPQRYDVVTEGTRHAKSCSSTSS